MYVSKKMCLISCALYDIWKDRRVVCYVEKDLFRIFLNSVFIDLACNKDRYGECSVVIGR